MSEKRIAVIPAYEPDRRMIDLVNEAWENGFQILIVDDGSGPEYSELFQEARKHASIIYYKKNRGKGHALKRAFSWLMANEMGDYSVITLDSDGQHTMKDALRLMEKLSEEPDSMWLGSRVLPKDAPLRSRFGNDVNRFLFRAATHTKVYDVQTGMRAFSSRLLPGMDQIPGERYEYEMNVLLDLARRHIPIREIEIETIYIDGNASSHFRPVPDSVSIYKQIIRTFGSYR